LPYAPLDLSGKVVFVTGGTSGIGRALVEGLAEAGADVIPSSRRPEQVEESAAAVEKRGRRTVRILTDVTSRESLQSALATTLKAFGRVDVLVNCAGRTKRQPTLEVSDEDWLGILDTNLNGTFRACQVFGRHMLERGSGKVVNIASLGSFVALRNVAAYCASKAAVASLTKSLSVEWGPQGVNVYAIAPGVFPTDLNRKLLDSPRGHELLARTPLPGPASSWPRTPPASSTARS
jgi:NAD(P)-dependent dehydrogenase (short-subunit alcohol dehydrogenase family)